MDDDSIVGSEYSGKFRSGSGGAGEELGVRSEMDRGFLFFLLLLSHLH